MTGRSVRVPWRSAAVLAVATVASGAVVWWIASLGGVGVFRARYGALAPLVTFPLHVLTTLTPVGEAIPFGAANGALYGLWPAALLNWSAWMTAAVFQRAFGARAVREAGGLPSWLGRLPLTHPLVLACGRWLPGGGVLVDAAAGAAGVPLGRHLLLAGLGHAPQAVALAAVGAGLLRLA